MKRIALVVLTLFLLIIVQMVSADVSLSQSEYFFTEIKGSTGPRRVVPITFTNSGSGSVTINSAAFVGPQASEFAFVTPPTLPLTLLSGQTVTYNVVFNPPGTTTYTPPYPPTAFRTASLQLNTTDVQTPVVNAALYGLSTNGTGGNNEPRLQMVTDILGYSTNVGSTAYLVRPLPEDFTPIGDEVVAQLFERVDGTQNVTMEAVMRFSPSGVINYGYYFPDGTSAPPLNEVNRISNTTAIGNGLNHQTLMPATATTNIAFNPGTQPFGLYALSPAFPSYTQDGLNGRVGQRVRAARTFVVRQRNGAARPNTYLVVFEDSTNGDFQDFGFLVTNVRPVNPPSGPTATPTNTLTPVPTFTPSHTPSATSTQPASGTCVYQEQGGSVVIEAEGFDSNMPALGDAWTLVTNISGQSGTGVMQTLPNDGTNTQSLTNGPRLTYTIAFTTPGTYYVALRGYGPSASDDTVFIGVNGAQVSQLGLGGAPLKWYEKFGTTDVSVNIPSAGTYTFMLWMREDGAVIDRIWLTTNVNAVTQGNTTAAPATSPCSGGAVPSATPVTPTAVPSNTLVPTATNTQPAASGCVYQEIDGSVVMEAEGFDSNTPALGDTWTLVTNVGAYSGTGAMQPLPNDGTNTQSLTNGPRLTYTIAFTTPGTYYVALRGYGPSASDDTVFIGVNGAQVSQVGLGGAPLKWYEKFGTTDVSVNIPSAGTYTFMLWMREDGAVIDRIWLTTNVNAVTQGNTTANPPNSPSACGGSPQLVGSSSGSPLQVVPAASPTLTATLAPSSTPLPTATATETFAPTATVPPLPTDVPTNVPTVIPTETPTDTPIETVPSETPAS